MAVFNTSQPTVSGSVTADIVGLTATNPTISNTTLTLAATEYSIVIPASTVRLYIKARNGSKLKFSYTLGDSGTTFVTVPAGSSYTEDVLNPAATLTLHVQSTTAGEIVELLTWT